MIEKEILSIEEINEKLKEKKDDKEKMYFLKEIYKDEDYKDKTRDIVKLITPLLLESRKATFSLSYDSLSEGMEHIYFWMLDFMRDTKPGGLNLKVWKGSEEMEASVSSGYFGEIGQRSTLMQQKAMEYMGTINNIIKSVLNLIYDLKEFEIRIETYDKQNEPDKDEKDAAIRSLKGIWMDQVDARKGRASINLLAQDLNFVTIRDAFFHVNDVESLEKIDLNERVKTILKRKLHEYNAWVKVSEKEIKTRYNVERAYLKSQIATLKMYSNWVKPYLKAAQKLKMKEFNRPDIVNAFSNMEFEVKLYGKQEIKPGKVHESFKDLEIENKYYTVIEVAMHFRSVPSVLSGQGGRQYVHGGRTDITFNGFSMDSADLEILESIEFYEDMDLIENYIGTSLKEVEDQIEKYTKEEAKEGKKEVRKTENPFAGVVNSFKEMFKPLKGNFHFKAPKTKFIESELNNIAVDNAKKLAFSVYNIYKKTHGMASL